MVTITIFLKGWRDGRLYCDAGNDPSHALHAAATKVRNRSWLAYEPGDEMYPTVSYTDADGDDLVHCERAFELFNVGERSIPIVDEYRSHGYRSLSVGDVVVVDGRAYTCDSVGWKLVENFAPTEPTA